MFKIHDHEQGTDEWFQARLGLITASVFDRIVTKTGKPSSAMEEISDRAVAELIVGEPDETFQSDAMLRGKELEDQALAFFNFTFDYDFKKCGFVDAGRGYGCSPDGLDLNNKVGLELKCPLAHTHLSYLSKGKMPDKYKQQVQGSMYVLGFDQWVFGSFHPSLPCFRGVIPRDEKYISAMATLLDECAAMVKEKHEKISRLVG